MWTTDIFRVISILLKRNAGKQHGLFPVHLVLSQTTQRGSVSRKYPFNPWMNPQKPFLMQKVIRMAMHTVIPSARLQFGLRLTITLTVIFR